MSEAKPPLGVERDGPVLRIRLQRPERRNALTRAMLAELIDRIESAADDEQTRVIAIGALGEHFCAGMDLADVNDPGGRTPRAGDMQRRMPRGANRLVHALREVQL